MWLWGPTTLQFRRRLRSAGQGQAKKELHTRTRRQLQLSLRFLSTKKKSKEKAHESRVCGSSKMSRDSAHTHTPQVQISRPCRSACNLENATLEEERRPSTTWAKLTLTKARGTVREDVPDARYGAVAWGGTGIAGWRRRRQWTLPRLFLGVCLLDIAFCEASAVDSGFRCYVDFFVESEANLDTVML